MPLKFNTATPLDADVYTLARERVTHILDTFDHVGVMFSGGKDSTAVLNVALEVLATDPRRWARHIPLRAAFWDEEAIPYETEEYVRRVSQRDDVTLEWLCLPLKHRNACSRTSPWWWPWAPEDSDRWCRPLPPEATTTLVGFPVWPQEARLAAPAAQGLLAPPHRGNTALLMGIRAAESLLRRRAVLMEREVNYLVKSDGGTSAGNLWKAYPIYDWTTEDVWTAPAKLGWDYNRAYDRMEAAGVDRNTQRCSPAFGEEPLEKLWTYAACFPDVWGRMVERVPGVGAAYRYARTELYGYRGTPEKPAGLAWPEFLSHYVRRALPAGQDATDMVNRLSQEIRLHYRKTAAPILPSARHPDTGISWSWLLNIAIRGDYKHRRAAVAGSIGGEDEQAKKRRWRRYIEELASIIAVGQFRELGHPGPPPPDPYALIPANLREEAAARGDAGATD